MDCTAVEVGSLSSLQRSPYSGRELRNGEVRILIVTRFGSDLDLRTYCHNLEDDLEFDAISYVWGPMIKTKSVKCNGSDLLITPRAFQMLTHLSTFQIESGRPIWIDAICINQQNPDEKAMQIPLMHRIYSQAKRVVVWLGPPTLQSNIFIHEITRIPQPWHQAAGIRMMIERWPGADSSFWAGLIQLLTADWFKRLWTFQEAVLAKSAIALCGDLWLDLESLIQFALFRWVHNENSFDEDIKRRIGRPMIKQMDHTAYYRFRIPIESGNFPVLLDQMRARNVENALDRVWALSGLLSKGAQAELVPLIDYSLAAHEKPYSTWARCARVIMVRSQQLTFLNLSFTAASRPPYVPSWCPDLSRDGIARDISKMHWNQDVARKQKYWVGPPECNHEEKYVARQRYKAVMGHEKKRIKASGDNFLHIHGFEIDTIRYIVEEPSLFEAWEYKDCYNNSDEKFQDANVAHDSAMTWLSRSLELSQRGKSQDKAGYPDTEFLMALFLDHRVDGDTRIACAHALDALFAGAYTDLDRLGFEGSWKAQLCIRRLLDIVGHPFFETSAGRFGIASPGCKQGDKVCVFYGGEPLYIVRPQENGADPLTSPEMATWEFVGTAYVPHVMDQHTKDDARQGPDRVFTLA